MIAKVILHAGTPKTGTTSLQVFLDRNRGRLLDRGILYPSSTEAAWKPKHQWLVPALESPDPTGFRVGVDAALREARPDTHTLVLSTEGLFHHWWDFSPAGRQCLAGLATQFAVELWVWFREPLSFVRSNYIQMLKNPRTWVACYGRDLSVEAMLDDPWFARHLDYIGYVDSVAAAMVSAVVRPFAYGSGDGTIAAFCGVLGLSGLEGGELREHPTVGDVGVDLLRVLNRRALSAEAKAQAVELVQRIDSAVGVSQPLQLAAATEARIRDLAGPSMAALKEHYGIDLTVRP